MSEEGEAALRSLEKDLGISLFLQLGQAGFSTEQDRVALDQMDMENSDDENMDREDIEKEEMVREDSDKEMEILDGRIREAQARYREAEKGYREAEKGCREAEARGRRGFPQALFVAPCTLSVGGLGDRVQGRRTEASSDSKKLVESFLGGEQGEPGRGRKSGRGGKFGQGRKSGQGEEEVEVGNLGDREEGPEVAVVFNLETSDVTHEKGKVSEKEAEAKGEFTKRMDDISEVSKRTWVHNSVFWKSPKPKKKNKRNSLRCFYLIINQYPKGFEARTSLEG